MGQELYQGRLFVSEITKWERHSIEGMQKADSYIITFDGCFQVWHNSGIVYESYKKDAAIAYANKCLDNVLAERGNLHEIFSNRSTGGI